MSEHQRPKPKDKKTFDEFINRLAETMMVTTDISEQVLYWLLHDGPTKLEYSIMADAIAIAVIIDPIQQLRSHKMHPNIHDAFKQYIKFVTIAIEDFLRGHLFLYDCVVTILDIINSTLIAKDADNMLRKIVRELIADYLHGLDTDADLRFERCNRYPNDYGQGVKVVANCSLEKGEIIHGLTGRVLKIQKEDYGQEYMKNDFSIIVNGRGQGMVYLGPGSFMNHDRQPNVEYLATENGKVAVKTLRKIQEGEGITVH
ncbi:hypothetical protein QAD02_000405 [Eretmocerus hayati]|uniref:Uncharacterized protein n=1 Tax=Eretmocerus hayati TaxID=131215 RepID=A0ACC2NEU8_9HYME|nr:hypothetical protein QAD02_000405 [Eretmocerus hayati]